MEVSYMGKLFSREQARAFLTEGNFKDGDAIADALTEGFKDLIQEALEAELDRKLGYSKYDWKNKEGENSRNGHSQKTLRSKFGNITVDVPRDVNAEFEPVIVKKHERKVNPSIDDMIISMYAMGTSTRDINANMKKIYGIDVSAEMVSRITDKVMPLAKEWQDRPLEPMYPILFLDGMVFNVIQDAVSTKKTGYLIFGINVDGHKEILGIWIGEAESAKFWLKVLTDLKNRGVKDILIASVDGLKGFEEAITAVFPQTEVQQSIVHQIRTSTKYVGYKDLKSFCTDMKTIYTAPNEEAALTALNTLEDKWGNKYGYAIKSWRNNWNRLATFFKYPQEIRRLIYTTNPIEAINHRIRKVTKTKTALPTDDALLKLLYLIVMDMTTKWTLPIHNWGQIVQQLSIHFGKRTEEYLIN
jgi:transposase-like protein